MSCSHARVGKILRESFPRICARMPRDRGGEAMMRAAWLSATAMSATVISTSAGALDLLAVAEANSKYADITVALKDGYIELPRADCITSASLGESLSSGDLGKLLMHPDRLLAYTIDGRIHIDRAWTNWVEPGLLIYQPDESAGYSLVGVANVTSPIGWAREGFVTVPTTDGQLWRFVWDDPSTEIDEAYGFEPHYTLRLWLFRENPLGTYAELNPKVSCNAVKSRLN